MKIILQRCLSARVEVADEIVGQIGPGLVVFLGVAQGDDEKLAEKWARKIVGLRIFSDADGRFNLSLKNVGAQVLLISNFTLLGDAKKGNRPSFAQAAPPAEANELFEAFAKLLRALEVPVETGIFGAQMRVFVENDGPVTLVLE